MSNSNNNNNKTSGNEQDEIITVDQLQSLVKQRIDLEEELQTLRDYLIKGGGSLFGLNGSFVDKEGYPSPHLDIIIEVKKARARIACIQTDYKILMKSIEDGMLKLHAQNKPQQQTVPKPSSISTPTTSSSLTKESSIQSPAANPSSASAVGSALAPATATLATPVKNEEPFVYIDLVTPGSPASKSGLQVNDRIVQFGSVGPFDKLEKTVQYLQSVAAVVRNSENTPITIRYIRNGDKQSTKLTPRKWEGQGLLGCLIKPITLID